MASPILDVENLGRRLRAARLIRGMSAEDVVAGLAQLGVETTRRTINAYERGDWMMPLDVFFAIAIVLAPEHGISYWTAALSDDMRARWDEVYP